MLEENIMYKKTITYINEIKGYSVIVYKYEFIETYITDM